MAKVAKVAKVSGREELIGTGKFCETTSRGSPNLPSDVWPDVEE